MKCSGKFEGGSPTGIWVCSMMLWIVLSDGGGAIEVNTASLLTGAFVVPIDLRLRRIRDGGAGASSLPAVSAISASLLRSLPRFPELKPSAIRVYRCSSARVRCCVFRDRFIGRFLLGLNTQSGCFAMNSAFIAAAWAM